MPLYTLMSLECSGTLDALVVDVYVGMMLRFDAFRI